jgi:hypothetical protein
LARAFPAGFPQALYRSRRPSQLCRVILIQVLPLLPNSLFFIRFFLSSCGG